jgi:hypothetical protein
MKLDLKKFDESLSGHLALLGRRVEEKARTMTCPPLGPDIDALEFASAMYHMTDATIDRPRPPGTRVRRQPDAARQAVPSAGDRRGPGEDEERDLMRLALISLDGSVANTRVINADTGEDVENVTGFTLMKPDDEDGPRLLLNVTVRIDDEPDTDFVHPIDAKD